jgi:hypothetical protein
MKKSPNSMIYRVGISILLIFGIFVGGSLLLQIRDNRNNSELQERIK